MSKPSTSLHSLRAHTLCLSLLAAVAACGGGNGFGSFAGDPSGGGGCDDYAVFPTSCASAGFALDGTVWHVTGTAEGKLGSCLPLGVIEPLCDMEWTLTASPVSEGSYDVHFDGSGAYFRARLCGKRLYFDGGFPIDLQQTGCVPGTPLNNANFAGHGTPPQAWLTFTDGLPPTGEADSAAGVVAVQWGSEFYFSCSVCEWELVLSLTPSDAMPLEQPTWSTGSLLLQGDARSASVLARADLGLLLFAPDGGSQWLPMELFAEGAGLEIELAPGPWALAIAPRPGSSESKPRSAELVEIRAGCRTSLDWSRRTVLASQARPTR